MTTNRLKTGVKPAPKTLCLSNITRTMNRVQHDGAMGQTITPKTRARTNDSSLINRVNNGSDSFLQKIRNHPQDHTAVKPQSKIEVYSLRVCSK